MPVFVIAASDPLVLSEAVDQHVPSGVPCQTYYGADLDCDTMFEQLGAPSLFAEQQAFHYADFTKINLRKKKDADRFVAMLDKLSPQTTLVCTQLISEETAGKEKQKKNTTDFKRVSSRGKYEDLCSLSDPRKAIPWIKSRAETKYGLILKVQQVENMYHACGNSISGVDSVLTKLWMFKPDDKPIPISDALLKKVLVENPESTFYELVDLVMEGHAKAINRLHDWFATEKSDFRFISEVGRKLLQLKALAEGQRIQPPWMEQRVQGLLRYYRGDKLKHAVLLAAEMEHAMKSGAIPAEDTDAKKLVLLELYVKRLGKIVAG